MITREELNLVRNKAKGLKAIVIGDAMLDKYIYGTVDRISPEAPVPILTHHITELKAGGAANVALNLAAWGCDTTLIGMTGKDSNSALLAGMLEKANIHHHLFESDTRPTTIKTRVVASSHHLLRIDEESTTYLNGGEEKAALSHIVDYLQQTKADLIIIEDYNKGFLTSEIISGIIATAKQWNAFIAVDPKEQNFFNYHGVNLFKPNLREASHAAGKLLSIGELSDLAERWCQQMSLGALAITLGAQGLYIHDDHSQIHQPPGHSIDVVDVCGAGDAVICALALGKMSGLKLEAIASLGNLTGSYVCSHSGVVTVDVDIIHHSI